MIEEKDESILDLIASLGLASRGWRVVDHWEADLRAIGVASDRDPRRLVYVSTFARGAGRYDYECEEAAGSNEEDCRISESGEDVDYETLVGVMERHFG